MEIRYCTDAGVFYVAIGQDEITGTAHISDDVMVDTEANGAESPGRRSGMVALLFTDLVRSTKMLGRAKVSVLPHVPVGRRPS